MFKELKEFINRIYKEEHPKSELSDDLKKEIEEKLKVLICTDLLFAQLATKRYVNVVNIITTKQNKTRIYV